MQSLAANYSRGWRHSATNRFDSSDAFVENLYRLDEQSWPSCCRFLYLSSHIRLFRFYVWNCVGLYFRDIPYQDPCSGNSDLHFLGPGNGCHPPAGWSAGIQRYRIFVLSCIHCLYSLCWSCIFLFLAGDQRCHPGGYIRVFW